MKRTKAFLGTAAAVLTAILPVQAVAQEAEDVYLADETDSAGSWDEMDDFDDLFSDAQDIEDAVETEPVTPVSQTTASSSAISFSGSTSFSAGAVSTLCSADSNIDRFTPAASFYSSLSFTARPSYALTVHGSVSTSFPNFTIGLSSLYADYIMFDKAYLTLGKFSPSWGNSFIFDTNVLDDSAKDPVNSDDINGFLNNSWGGMGSCFSLSATVPFKAGQILAVAQTDTASLSKSVLSFATSVEYPFHGFSFTLFAKNWSSASGATGQHKSPAAGLSVSGDLGDYHLNLWGVMNVKATWPSQVTYSRFVAGFARYWQSDPKMAFDAEYEFIYDNQNSVPEFSHKLGFQYAWSHIAGSICSPSLQAFLNVGKLYGVVVPAATLSGIPGLPYSKFNIACPIFFGNQSTSYNGITVTSTSTHPAVLLGAVLSVSVSY